jgi:predicted phage terminase large subunit-like protein
VPEEINIRPQPGPQEKFLKSSADIAIFGGARGGGKLLPRGGVVLTPFGFKKSENLKVGDRVNAPDGTTSRIIQLHPWVRLPGVRVHFHDGTSTVVAWDHLWLAWRSGKRKKLPGGNCVFGEPAAEVIETRQLKEWLDKALEKSDRTSGDDRGINWPLIPVCKPQVFNVQFAHPILLDPYKLGVWLGDGHAGGRSVAVGITSVDHAHMERHLPEFNSGKDGKQYRVVGEERVHWATQLERAGLLGCNSHDKFIPKQYLYGSIKDRWSMLQGLMDTDGTVDTRGQLYYCTVSEQLSKDVVTLVQSLGGTATVFKKKPFYRGEDGEKVHCQLAYNIYIKLHDEEKAFRLKRKRERCKTQGLMYRRVVKIEEIEEIEGRCLTVSHPSGLYMTNDFIVTHNSYALLMDAMRYCIGTQAIKGYNALLLRTSFQQILKSGGLLSASNKIYPYAGANFGQTSMRWSFPSGATVDFGHMEHEKDKNKYLGLELPYIGFDEVNMFSESQFWFMLSSNRSTLGVPSRIRATCNPDSSSWVADFISWWIDQDTGFPIPERDGVHRYFVRLENDMYWNSSPDLLWEEVKDHYDDKREFLPKSATFIKSLLSDNKILTDSDPSYKATLMQMPEVDRMRFLEGNWLVSPTEGSEWERCPQYFSNHLWTEHWPDQFVSSAIYIDPSKGRTERSDYSAIVFVGLKGGKIYVRSDIKRRPAEEIVRDAIGMYQELKPNAFAIERNTFQELLAPMFDMECERSNLPPIPIQLPYSAENKETRIRSLGAYLEREKLLLHKQCDSNKLMYRQLKNFGIKGAHDDGPDALEGAIRMLFALGTDPMDEEPTAPEEDDLPEFDVAIL